MSDAPKSGPMRSLGRKTIRPSAKPSSLMDDPFELAGIWQARIVTLFPEAFPGVLGLSLTGKALTDGKWQLFTHDLRTFGIGRHRNVDDTPAGGGAGMVMRADVVGPALAEAQHHAHGRWPILYMSPRGRPFDQAMARDLADCAGVTMLCGRFEGVDERVIEHYGIKLDEAIRSGIKIAYTDSLHSKNQAAQTTFGSSVPDFWKPHEEWTLD